MPARLTVHFPARPARVLLLADGEPAVVGREPGCDVVLDDDRVSRRHVQIGSEGGRWWIRDLGSKNGLALDGVTLAEGPLPDRAWLSLGGLPLEFERLSEAALERARAERSQRLATSLEVQRRLDPALGLAGLLQRVVASMLELTGAERAYLLLASPEGQLEVAAAAPGPASEPFPGSQGALSQAFESGLSVVSDDALADARLAGRASVVATGIRALVAVPLRALERILGVLYADSGKPGAAFTELDLDILEAMALQAGLAIAVVRLDAELQGLAARLGEARP